MNLYKEIGEEKIDLLIDVLYDDIIANDDRINFLFHKGFAHVKSQQKKFFRVFLGAEANVFHMPDLKQAHNQFPIPPEIAKYWVEDFEVAIDKIDINPNYSYFLKQKIRTLGMSMINTLKK